MKHLVASEFQAQSAAHVYVSVSVKCEVSRFSGHRNASESFSRGSRSAPIGSARSRGRRAHRSQLIARPFEAALSLSGVSMSASSGHSVRRQAAESSLDKSRDMGSSAIEAALEAEAVQYGFRTERCEVWEAGQRVRVRNADGCQRYRTMHSTLKSV